ncbi:hypothetical protein CYMTET_18828 [Cymbomonas tetramitiformis]|uniref:Uncharacterized protein n=1 Tax=Cymbomonas tetramitiformis TaxID=36881 RepID=A0AAE0G8L7_9CHLO|nr:hypothetical protein CYMTET_18828 [Cymbomonas tetramitiformis]
MRLDSIFARNVGARYKSTPQSAHVALAAADKTRGNAVLQSSWDIDVVKRVAKDTLGTKASSFSGSEPHRQLLWDSLVTALEASFVNKDNANEDIFDLVDVTKEVHPIFNDILLRALVSLTTPHSPARRWVDASARISPRDGKRALLEITKRLLPPGHRPLRHHEELLGITFGSSNDPEPLVAQFDECLKAIAASGAGPLDDEAAKRQLLAALDADFYKEVITPLRLDTELAKVSIEEVYTHVLEVWWGANPNGPPTRPNTAAPIHTHTPLGLAYAGDEQSGISDFLEEFARIIGEASTLLASLRSDEREVARDTPPPRNDFPRRHGGGGVKFPPSKWRDERNRRTDGKFHGRNRHVGWKHRFAASTLPKGGNWPQGMKPQGARSISFHSASSAFVQECPLCPGHFHDTARCPEVCGSCDVDLRDAAMDLDEVVSAFQTAFDNENDEEFADLCHEHDQPLVRTDPEPFTYPVRHDVGLRAHYAGLGHGASDAGIAGVLSDARGVLDSLRSAATAAQVGGAAAGGKQPPLHIGTLSVPQVVCDAPPPANHEIDGGLHPVSASDPASFGSPFEEPLHVNFMDRVMPSCPNTSLKLCSIDSVHESIHPGELSVIDDDDGSDSFSYSGDEIPSAPPATRSRVGVATLPRFFSFASLALPALMCLACVSAVQGSVVLDRAPEFTAAVHPTGVTANSLSDLPCCFTFGIPFPSVVSAGLNSDFQFSEFLNLLYESFPASGFWSWLLDYGSGFWFWTLVSGLWFWIMTSGLWFWLNFFDTDNFFNPDELCNFVDHFQSG